MRGWGRGRAHLIRFAAVGSAVGLMLGVVTVLGGAPTRAAAAPVRVTMPGSATYPGPSVYTGSWSLGITRTVHPKISLARGVRFVRGKLVVAKLSGTRWVTDASTTATRRGGLRAALSGGRYRITLTVRTVAPGRSRSTAVRKVSYLTVWPGPKPSPPVVVVPPPPPAPPSLVQGASWYGREYDDSQDPGRPQYGAWIAIQVSNASSTVGLARSRREILLPSMFPSSIFDDVPTLAAGGRGWFVTSCVSGCQVFPLDRDIRIQPFSAVASSIDDATRPLTSQSSVTVVPGPVVDIASVATTVTNPSTRPLAAGTPAHVVVLSGQTPVYAFRSVTPAGVAAGASTAMKLVPTGTTGFRWSELPDPSSTTVQITLDPAP